MQSLAKRLATVVRRPWPDPPVPVCLVITDLDVGGAERALVALATRLDRRRWDPSVIALGNEGALVAPLRQAGIETICLDVARERPFQAVVRLAKALRCRKPRLVQSFLFHANVASRLAAPLAGCPWVVGGLRVAERQKGWHVALDRRTASLSAGSVCVSEGVRRFNADAGISPDRLTVIPNGIDPLRFDHAEKVSRSELGVPEEAHLVVYVGRLDVQKGIPFLLDAAEQVVATRPQWHLAMVGDGPERASLRARTDSSALLSGRVHWLGRRDDIPSVLKAADLLVLPSLWEGMPNVVLEAMAARRAVVATAVEGTEDLVITGQTGWLVPTKDAEALAGSLEDAVDHPNLTRQYGEAGRRRIESEFSVASVVNAYEHLWAGVLGLEIGAVNDP